MKSTTTRRAWSTCIAMVAFLGASTASAQTARSYAVLSLMGDKITVVMPDKGVSGSRLDHNPRQEVAIPDDVFDGDAAQAANTAIKRIEPTAVTKLYSTRDPKLFALQDSLVDSQAQPAALMDSLKALLVQSKATHLLLITKHRGDTRIKLAHHQVGDGKLVGLGFYVDPVMDTYEVEGGNRSKGFIAPYAYIKLSLIDAATLQALRQRVATSTQVHTGGSNATDAWNVLTGAEKVRVLRAVIHSAIDEAMPELLATP